SDVWSSSTIRLHRVAYSSRENGLARSRGDRLGGRIGKTSGNLGQAGQHSEDDPQQIHVRVDVAPEELCLHYPSVDRKGSKPDSQPPPEPALRRSSTRRDQPHGASYRTPEDQNQPA